MTVETAWLIGEYGSQWESWSQSWCAPERQLILTLQGRAESRAAFYGRVTRELDASHARRHWLRRVLLAFAVTEVGVTWNARAALVARVCSGLTGRAAVVEVRLLPATYKGGARVLY